MGKGDQKTKRGKINAGTFGNSRPAKVSVNKAPKADKAEEKTEKKKSK